MSPGPFHPARARAAHRLVALLATVAGLSGFAADNRPAAGPIVELPKFVVTDERALPEPEPWRYAAVPGFEILSSASDRATKRLVSDFQVFRDAVGKVWPTPTKLKAPVMLIIAGRARQFEAFEPASAEGGIQMAHASLHLKGRTESAIVVNLGSSVVDVASFDAAADTANGEDTSRIVIDHNKQLYREYVHYLLSNSEPRFPAWFEEGLAQVIMAMQFTPKWIEFGKLTSGGNLSSGYDPVALDPNSATAETLEVEYMGTGDPLAPAEDQDFNVALARRRLMPLPAFFAVDRNAPETKNPLGNNVWAKQAYAFVHFGLFGEGGRWRKPFGEFVLRATREPATEAVFQQCFGMSYADMALQLRRYVMSANYQTMVITPKDGHPFMSLPAIDLRDATPAEIGRIKGRAMLLAGRTEAARTELIAPYMRGNRDPQLLAALGLIEHAAGLPDRARKFLTAAVEAQTRDPEAYLELARYRLADANAAPAAPGKQLSRAQVESVTKLLDTARELPPANFVPYELLAETYARAADRPKREEVLVLIKGAQLFPHRFKLVYSAAALSADAGMLSAAHALADHGLQFAPEGPLKAQFKALKAALPPATPTK